MKTETLLKAWYLEVWSSFLKTGSFAAFWVFGAWGGAGGGGGVGGCQIQTRHGRTTTGAKTHPYAIDVCEKVVSVANREQAAAHLREGAADPCGCAWVCMWTGRTPGRAFKSTKWCLLRKRAAKLKSDLQTLKNSSRGNMSSRAHTHTHAHSRTALTA